MVEKFSMRIKPLNKGPYNKIMLHWDGLKIFIKLKKYTKVILN